MRPLLIAVVLPVLLLAGCASTPSPTQLVGKTGEAVLDSVPRDQAVIEYNVAGLLHVGNPDDLVTDQSAWRVVTACSNKGQLILGMVRDSAYMGQVKAKAEKGAYKGVLRTQCS